MDSYILTGVGVIIALIGYIYNRDMSSLNKTVSQLSTSIHEMQKFVMEKGFVTNARCDNKYEALSKRVDTIEHDLLSVMSVCRIGKRGD